MVIQLLALIYITLWILDDAKSHRSTTIMSYVMVTCWIILSWSLLTGVYYD